MKLENMEIITSNSVPKGELFFVPKIPRLCVKNGKLQIAETFTVKGQLATVYRDLSDAEMRQFGHIKGIA